MILTDPVSKLFVYCVSNSALLFFFTLRRHFVDATDLQTKSHICYAIESVHFWAGYGIDCTVKWSLSKWKSTSFIVFDPSFVEPVFKPIPMSDR